jgi:hypothetical protein
MPYYVIRCGPGDSILLDPRTFEDAADATAAAAEDHGEAGGGTVSVIEATDTIDAIGKWSFQRLEEKEGPLNLKPLPPDDPRWRGQDVFAWLDEPEHRRAP